MNESSYPDLLEDAATAAVQQAIEYASIAAALGRGFIRYRLTRERERELLDAQARAAAQAQLEADKAAARARWAPGNDPDWIGEATLLDTATVWCAAVPHADADTAAFDETALSAVRACEDRLRQLHPHAMARYDRLRDDGQDPVTAMREAAPLFMRSPSISEQPGAAHAAIEPGNGLGHSWVAVMQGPSREEFDSYLSAIKVLRRGAQILHGMQARAARTGLPRSAKTISRPRSRARPTSRPPRSGWSSPPAAARGNRTSRSRWRRYSR
jgi:hypothetical protein